MAKRKKNKNQRRRTKPNRRKKQVKKQLAASNQVKETPKDALVESIESLDNLIKPFKERDIKVGSMVSPKVKRLLKPWAKGSLLAIGVVFAALIGQTYYQNNDTSVRVEYMKVAKEKELPYLNVIRSFKLNKSNVRILSYVDESGLKFSLFDLDAKRVIHEDVISGDVELAPNSVAVLAQILELHKEPIKEIGRAENGWIVNGAEQKTVIKSFRVVELNEKAVTPSDIYFLAASHQDLIKRNKLDVSKLDIGYIGPDLMTEKISIVASGENGNIYNFIQYEDGRVKLQIKKVG